MELDYDIEEIESILGIKSKTNELNSLIHKSSEKTKNFLEAISLVINSNKFNSDSYENNTPEETKQPLKNDLIIRNANLFYSPENTDKLKIDYIKSQKEFPINEIENQIEINKESDVNLEEKDKNKKQKRKKRSSKIKSRTRKQQE